MRRALTLLLALVLCASPALAKNDQVTRGPVEDWVNKSDLLPVPENASGLLFVRRNDSIVHLDGNGQRQYLGYRLKLLHSNALQLGNLTIAWDPYAGSPVVHGIKIYRGSETIDVLATSSFEILRREDRLEASHLDGTLTAVLRVPDLRVGDELEVEMTTPSKDIALGDKDVRLLFLGPNPQPGRYHLGLNWVAGQEPKIKMTPEMAQIAKRSASGIDLTLDNPKLQMPPKDAPPRYNWQRLVEYSDYADWNDLARQFARLFEKASTLAPKSPLKAEAARIVSSYPTAQERMAAALKLVQGDIRYVFVGLNGGNYAPADADETWVRRYGDCKGKSALLLALLHEMGIKAEAVLANNSGGDDGIDERLPSALMFDHVLVRATIDNKTYWLDGTLPSVILPSEEPVFAYRWILPVNASGQGLVRLPWKPAVTPDEINLFQIDASQGFGKTGKLVQTSIQRGTKAIQEYLNFSAATPDQLREALTQQLIGETWQAIDEVSWHFDEKRQASVLKIAGTGKIDWEDEGAGARSLVLPGGGFSPPESRTRPAGADRAIPFYRTPSYDCYVTTVILPKSTQPRQWAIGTSFDTHIFGANHYRAFEIRDGTVRMIRGFRVEKPEIDATTAARDNARISRFDNSKAVVNYDPKGTSAPAPASRPVPTTSSIDWTVPDVPCLADHAARPDGNVSVRDDAAARFDEAVAAEQAGRREEALAGYGEVIRLDNTHAQAYINRGIIYLDSGQYPQAASDFTRAIALTPDNPFAYANRGVAYAWMRMNDQARADFAATRRIDKDNFVAFHGDALICMQVRDNPCVVKNLTSAIAVNADDKWAYARRAAAYHLMGREDLAARDRNTLSEITARRPRPAKAADSEE